ncbi:S8 family peptidase, partial [Anaerorhabdus sp.]
ILNIDKRKVDFNEYSISKSAFLGFVVDSHFVEKFGILENKENLKYQSIVTIYKTKIDTITLLEKLDIHINYTQILDKTTILLKPDDFDTLKEKAPYLIAMAVEDISTLAKEDFIFENNTEMFSIPEPKNEPTIGVIDTYFDESVYFSNWVDFIPKVSQDIEIVPDDYLHGTAVSSIIVDGSSINPDLDDGCGRFQVRHFGVATNSGFSSFSILKAIDEIIRDNRDIKVWNLSLGSSLEINPNFISPEAAILDKIQFENDVIFVIAGTNKDSGKSERMRIGAPADSINSIVVNSVNRKKEPATYSREGIVLSFFNKPDISYFGGDTGELIRVCTPTGEQLISGTSFAAPWIARKVAYLIEILGLSREVAKALIIDSATGWSINQASSSLIGHGVVPQRIENVVKTDDSEIKFIISGISEKYDTYTHNIPVPVHNDKHPFIAKATLCYFPNCSRNQGVDYTNTELDVYLGRVNQTTIKSINKNIQSIDNIHYLHESSARKLFRKWDNTKHVVEIHEDNAKPKKAYNNGLWGVSVKTKERLERRDGEGIKFGLIVTLKELNGINRIEEFIQQCSLRGWLVNKVDVINQLEIYNKAQEIIVFDEDL